MKLPRHAPRLTELLAEPGLLATVIGQGMHAEVAGEYSHFSEIYYKTPPPGLDRRAWWLALKLARASGRKSLPLLDKAGRHFSITQSDSMSRRLHFLDRETAGNILGLRKGDKSDGDAYLKRSLIEEAMTSAQLEGASTTRAVAKDMLLKGRAPRDLGERMIANNFEAMNLIREWYDSPITPERIYEIHRVVCADTLDDEQAAGRLRREDEPIRIFDNRDGTLLHDPPPASELPRRMERLCAFANDTESSDYLHPIVRAIALHFQIGYDHPFVDGNGRTARVLFYWAMGRQDYWLTEFVSISSVLRKAPTQYARAYLYTEDDENDLGYFVDHQLRVLEQAVDGFRGYMVKKTEEAQRARLLVTATDSRGAKLKLNGRQRAVLLNALSQPTRRYRIADHQAIHQVAYQSARNDLLELARMRLLRKITVGKRFEFEALPDLQQRLAASRT